MSEPIPLPSPEHIRLAREFVRQSMTEASQRVHRSPQVWSKWERGIHRMPLAEWELYLWKVGLRDKKRWQRAVQRFSQRAA